MKHYSKKLLALLLAALLALSFTACSGKADETTEAPQNDASQNTGTDAPGDTEKVTAEGLWKDAKYRSDKSFGEGAKTIQVEVKVEDKAVTFTIKTDKSTLGDALIEHAIAEGEAGQYGLYIKKVNGILADYDVDQHYWSISKNGTPLMTGADGEKINGGEHYEVVRAK